MKKLSLLIIGLISLSLGILGIFLPLLPTTPLILLSALCFMKSSNSLYKWLINNKYLGIYIKNYYEKKGIPLKTKIFVITTLWLSIGYSIIVLLDLLFVEVVLFIIAILVTIHIMKQNTIRL